MPTFFYAYPDALRANPRFGLHPLYSSGETNKNEMKRPRVVCHCVAGRMYLPEVNPLHACMPWVEKRRETPHGLQPSLLLPSLAFLRPAIPVFSFLSRSRPLFLYFSVQT